MTAGNQSLHVLWTDGLASGDDDECGSFDQSRVVVATPDHLGAPTSVAFAPNGDLITYYPEFPALVIRTMGFARTVRLPGDIGYDSGRAMFHEQTGVGAACASWPR